MDFDLADTPTLQAVATSDETLLAKDLEKRVAEALEQAGAQKEVLEAADTLRAADANLAGLQSATRKLNQHTQAVSKQIAAATGKAVDTLIQSSSEGEPDFGASQSVVTLEHENRMAARALERLVEHLMPLAQVTQMRVEAHFLATRGRVLERLANERAEKVLTQIREAVSDEMVLPVDLSKGVAGSLLAQASQVKRRSVELSANADRLEQWYMENNRKGK